MIAWSTKNAIGWFVLAGLVALISVLILIFQ